MLALAVAAATLGVAAAAAENVTTVFTPNVTEVRVRVHEAAEWMGERFGDLRDRTLLDIVLPGAHDAGSYHLERHRSPEFPYDFDSRILSAAKAEGQPLWPLVSRWAKAQPLPVSEQLRLGARYLHLRGYWDPEAAAWSTGHVYLGQDLLLVLRQVVHFLHARPREVVIVNLQLEGLWTADQAQRLTAAVEDLDAAPIIAPATALANATVGALVDQDMRLLLAWNGDDRNVSSPVLWPASHLFELGEAPVGETRTVPRAFDETVRLKGGQPGRLLITPWHLAAAPASYAIGTMDTLQGVRVPVKMPRSLVKAAIRVNDLLRGSIEVRFPSPKRLRSPIRALTSPRPRSHTPLPAPTPFPPGKHPCSGPPGRFHCRRRGRHLQRASV